MYLLRSICFLIFLVTGSLLASKVEAQHAGTPFTVDVISVKADNPADGSRLDLYTALPYASLRFLKEGDEFSASYEVEVEVFSFEEDNKAPVLVEKDIWSEAITVPDFGDTQSSSLASYSTRSFSLASGRYLIKIHVKDQATQDIYNSEVITEVRDFSADVSLSNLILVNDYDLSSQSISPRVSDRVFSDEQRFKLFYELYSNTRKEVNVQFRLIRTQNSRGLPILRWIFRRQSDGVSGEITYERDRPVRLSDSRQPSLLEIPISDFEAGEYLLRVTVADLGGEVLDISERAITLAFSDRAEYQGRDIDAAIAQLKYVAKPGELREIRGAKTKQERQERFMEFWEKRDPTPGTPENEQMQEYYVRIDYANRHYSGANSGWETDRGYTLVLYGEPDEVDRSALDVELNQPYEVWHYHRIGRRFIFVDRAGTGNFELLTPTWSERTVIR